MVFFDHRLGNLVLILPFSERRRTAESHTSPHITGRAQLVRRGRPEVAFERVGDRAAPQNPPTRNTVRQPEPRRRRDNCFPIDARGARAAGTLHHTADERRKRRTGERLDRPSGAELSPSIAFVGTSSSSRSKWPSAVVSSTGALPAILPRRAKSHRRASTGYCAASAPSLIIGCSRRSLPLPSNCQRRSLGRSLSTDISRPT